MKKRLLIFHATVPTYRIDLFNKLTDLFEVRMIVYGKKENIEKLGFDYKAVANDAKFDYTVYDSGLYFGNNHLISTMYYHEIKKFKPNIVFCQELGINTLVAIALKKIFGYKIYINCDDSPDMLLHYSPLRKCLRKFVYNKIDGVLVVNTDVEKVLKTSFPNCRFLYFPIIQDENRLINNLENSKDISDKYLKRFDLENNIVFLFVGRLVEEKQPMMLLEAFNQANLPNSKLIIVGQGVLYDQIECYITRNNLAKKIIMTGKLEGKQLYAWYKIADYFVLPSKYEPFGAVVNEALISGCKTIVGEKVGAKTLINSQNGYIFDSNDLKGLKSLLKECFFLGKKRIMNNLMPIQFNNAINNLIQFLN